MSAQLNYEIMNFKWQKKDTFILIHLYNCLTIIINVILALWIQWTAAVILRPHATLQTLSMQWLVPVRYILYSGWDFPLFKHLPPVSFARHFTTTLQTVVLHQITFLFFVLKVYLAVMYPHHTHSHTMFTLTPFWYLFWRNFDVDFWSLCFQTFFTVCCFIYLAISEVFIWVKSLSVSHPCFCSINLWCWVWTSWNSCGSPGLSHTLNLHIGTHIISMVGKLGP